MTLIRWFDHREDGDEEISIDVPGIRLLLFVARAFEKQVLATDDNLAGPNIQLAQWGDSPRRVDALIYIDQINSREWLNEP